MIKGFEEQTHELTSGELLLVDPVVNILKQAVGKEQAIKSGELIAMVSGLACGSRVRKLINHIRVNALIDGLVATSNGYYVTNDWNELESYEASLSERIRSIQRVLSSIRKQRWRMVLRSGSPVEMTRP